MGYFQAESLQKRGYFYSHSEKGSPVFGAAGSAAQKTIIGAGGAMRRHKASDTVPRVCPPSPQPKRAQCQCGEARHGTRPAA
jgi:hypothetical protein